MSGALPWIGVFLLAFIWWHVFRCFSELADANIKLKSIDQKLETLVALRK